MISNKKSIWIGIVLLAAFLTPVAAHAFVFTDPAAHTQRVMQLSRQLQQIQQMTQYINQFNAYKNQFDTYKNQFDFYYMTFKNVYRRLNSSDWAYYLATNWSTLMHHGINIWKTFDDVAWQRQVISLRTTPQYTSNPDFKKHADDLITLSEEQVDHLKQEEAHLIELQNQDAEHATALDRFKQRNEELVTGGSDEVVISHQIALTNQILIESALIQAQIKVVTQRILTDQREQRNLMTKMKTMEDEVRQSDGRNFQGILDKIKVP